MTSVPFFRSFVPLLHKLVPLTGIGVHGRGTNEICTLEGTIEPTYVPQISRLGLALFYMCTFLSYDFRVISRGSIANI